MASALSSGKVAARFISYSRSTNNIRALVGQIRRFSWQEDSEPDKTFAIGDQAKPVTWPDEKMGPLNVPDLRFALPGNIGTTKNSEQPKTDTELKTDILPEDNQQRHLTVISQLIAESDYLDPEDRPSTEMADRMLQKYFESARVELTIQDCPNMIFKDFASLFPDLPTLEKLTVVTIAQRTKSDMSGWSEEVEVERDQLLGDFIATATEICHLLKAYQYWCDFIDPSSGQPHFGPYTNTTFYETDERYRHLGFSIEDLGCCKVIYHKKWGSKVFVGSIFTTAPKDHSVMQELLRIKD